MRPWYKFLGTSLPRTFSRSTVPGIGDLDFALHESGDIWISDVIKRGDTFDPHVLTMLRRLLREGDLLVDIGANIGWFTVIGSRLVGARGCVVAVEPSPSNAELLRGSVKRNRCRNVTLFETALGAEKGMTRLYLSTDNQGDHRTSRTSLGREHIDVPVQRFDSLRLPSRPAEGATVVKIDTQGSEAAILAGMPSFIAATPRLRVIMEFWPHGLESCGASSQEVLAFFSGERWRIWILDPGGAVRPTTVDTLLELARTIYRPSSERFADLVILDANDDAGLAAIEMSLAETAGDP